MAESKAVVDASVLIKWFSPEIDREKALRLREDHIQGRLSIIIPELAFLEVMNGLRYKKAAIAELEKVQQQLWASQLCVEPLTPILLKTATSIAVQAGISVYDAFYVAVARAHSCRLITADRELAIVPGAALL